MINELDYMKSLLKVFKSLPEGSLLTRIYSNEELESLDKRTLKFGFIIDFNAKINIPREYLEEIISYIKDNYGYDLLELNRGFFSNFNYPKEYSREDVFINQILHYITTYGFESLLGKYNEDCVYIPERELFLSDSQDSVKIHVIKSISKEEIKLRVKGLLNSGVALSSDTLLNLINIIEYLNLDIDIDSVKNKEVKVYLYESLNLLPSNPEEFLRYLLYKAREYSINKKSFLLIKDSESINALKSFAKYSSDKCKELIDSYIEQNSLIPLAKVFFRFKPLFLALKSNKELISLVNKLRKLANIHHSPKETKILDRINSSELDISEVKKELSKVSIFKKITLLNSILYRISNPDSIAYFVRNGKVFSKEFNNSKFKFNLNLALLLREDILAVLKSNVEGKTVYIPEGMEYACPISEKKFWGSIPFGSSYKFKSKQAIVGVHWFNLDGSRVDLDLHMQSDKRNVGWDTYHSRNNYQSAVDEQVIFSGDMTDAPKSKGGAIEAFYLGKDVRDELFMLNLNNYTYYKGTNENVKFKLVVNDLEENNNLSDRKYLIDSVNLCFNSINEIPSKQMFIGFIDSDEEGNKRFLYSTSSIGNRIVARYNENSKNLVEYIRKSFQTCLKLKEMLILAGARFEKEDDKNWDINLDVDSISKDSILDLFKIKT